MHNREIIISGYDEPILTRAGILSECTRPSMAANIQLHADVSPVFPYLKAVEPEARWYSDPNYIQFSRNNVQCTLYPDEAIVMPFSSKGQALLYINELITFLNELYARRESLSPNFKKETRPVSAIAAYKLLPGTNCKACGFTSCLAFAAALSRNMAKPHQCPDFSPPLYQSATYPVLDKNGKLQATIALEVSNQDPARPRDTRPAPAPEVAANLTNREIEVLRLIAEGATNAEIAVILSISPHTVKSHVINIFNKLGVNDRTQAAVWAARHNIVLP